jgi:glycosyltransferase involved in cell wall biosynthesis
LNLTLVSPSQWLTDCARASSLFHDYQIKTIPNGLDLKRFRPVDKHLARELLSLPREKKLILFGAMDSTSDRNKGFHFLLSALKTLEKRGWADRCEILIFGGRAPLSPHPLEFKFHYMGRLYDDISLMLLYSAADVIVSPSIQENLSNVVLESMACGTPCVAFKIGGMPDMIEHEQNGYLAEPFEIEDLANGIVWMLSDGERLKLASRLAREKSVKEFSIGSVARQYSDLYKELIV